MNIGPTICRTDPDFARVQRRRHALMRERQLAVAERDWPVMNEITKRLAKLPILTVARRQTK
jgi:hypothetical protein